MIEYTAMTTHRSLNKLERRSYMNIHNVREVKEKEPSSKKYTRDRFGKRQDVKGRVRGK